MIPRVQAKADRGSTDGTAGKRTFPYNFEMEKIQSINSGRVIWACRDAGISTNELAAEVGISAATIERLVAGEGRLSYSQLAKLADFFGRGTLFFLDPAPIEESRMHSPEFRTLANMKPDLSPRVKALIKRVEKQRDIYLGLVEDLDDSIPNEFVWPEIPAGDIAGAARVARAWWGLGEQNSFDSYRKSLEAKGMLVFRSNGYNGKWQISKESPILAFSLVHTRCPVIVVKKTPWEAQQCFSLFHELGHLLLHRESSIDDEADMRATSGRERQANQFAGLLLVPDLFLARVSDASRPRGVEEFDAWLKPYRNTWGVSTEVILRRLLDVGRLSAGTYAAYRQWRESTPFVEADGGTRLYRHREPRHMFGDAFVRTVFDALSARNITLAKASTYLDGLKLKDLHQLERHIAGV